MIAWLAALAGGVLAYLHWRRRQPAPRDRVSDRWLRDHHGGRHHD